MTTTYEDRLALIESHLKDSPSPDYTKSFQLYDEVVSISKGLMLQYSSIFSEDKVEKIMQDIVWFEQDPVTSYLSLNKMFSFSEIKKLISKRIVIPVSGMKKMKNIKVLKPEQEVVVEGGYKIVNFLVYNNLKWLLNLSNLACGEKVRLAKKVKKVKGNYKVQHVNRIDLLTTVSDEINKQINLILN